MVNKLVQDPCARSAGFLGQSGVGLNLAELAQCRKAGDEMAVKGQENLEQNCSRAWGKIAICQYALGRKCYCWTDGQEGMYGFVIPSISN